MKVAILCGGFGTRIRDVADDIPKPMIPIGGFPIVWHIMKYYAHWDFNEFILCLGHQGQVIKDFFLNYEAHTRDFTIQLSSSNSIEFHDGIDESDWKVTLASTGINAMTGARIKRIQRYLNDGEDFLLTYGDGVSDVDLRKLLAFHKSHGKALTVTGVRPPGRFGELTSDLEGTALEFNEKPQATGGRISGGFFACNKKIFDFLDDSEDLVFELEPMRQLVRKGEMKVFEHDGFWQPMECLTKEKLLG
jgi:glucose-1-phosphate cytidylyltransferase